MNYRDKQWIAVIGSREPTDRQELKVIQLIEDMFPDNQLIISGCAYGIDALALQTGQNLMIETIGMLPWSSYNPDIQQYCDRVRTIEDLPVIQRQEAFNSVDEYHPASARLSQGARKLHARNYGIIRWADKVIAAPSDKKGGGGTGQGIRLAEALGKSIVIVDATGGIHYG